MAYILFPEMKNTKFICTSLNGKVGIINFKNEIITPFEYRNYDYDTKAKIHFLINEKYERGILNDEGKLITKFFNVISMNETGTVFIIKGENNKYGLMDIRTEKILLPFEYYVIDYHGKGKYRIFKEGQAEQEIIVK